MKAVLDEDEQLARISPEHPELLQRARAQQLLLSRHQPFKAPDGVFCAWHAGEHRVPWPCLGIQDLAAYLSS
jgi:hypothetical protein